MIVITVALFEVLFIFYMKEYYHGMARSYLEQQVDNISVVDFTSFEEATNSVLERENVNKDINLGIQVINKDKELILDQYGIKTQKKIDYEDILGIFYMLFPKFNTFLFFLNIGFSFF